MNSDQTDAADKVRDTIMQLSQLCDLVAYGDYITKHTKFGKKPHLKDIWGYTRAYMQSYGDPGDTEAVIALYQSADLPNEVEAARWLLQHDNIVP